MISLEGEASAMLGGIIPVTIAIPPKYEASNAVFLKLSGVISQLDARHVIASTANVAPLSSLLPSHVEVHDSAQLDWQAANVVEAQIDPSDVVFYQLTSGSTGTRRNSMPGAGRGSMSRHRAIVRGGQRGASLTCVPMLVVVCGW